MRGVPRAAATALGACLLAYPAALRGWTPFVLCLSAPGLIACIAGATSYRSWLAALATVLLGSAYVVTLLAGGIIDPLAPLMGLGLLVLMTLIEVGGGGSANGSVLRSARFVLTTGGTGVVAGEAGLLLSGALGPATAPWLSVLGAACGLAALGLGVVLATRAVSNT